MLRRQCAQISDRHQEHRSHQIVVAGKTQHCLVCGRILGKGNRRPFGVWQGEKYRFYSTGCRNRFERNRDLFLNTDLENE